MARDDTIIAQTGSPDLVPETAVAQSSGLEVVSPNSTPADRAEAEMIRIALIDGIPFSQDCLVRAFNATHPDMLITPFDSVSACLQSNRIDLDAVLYFMHDDGLPEHRMLQCIVELRKKFALTPVVVLSDSPAARQPQSIRSALESGARGYITARDTRVPAVIGALRFIKDGGTFVPIDLLLSSHAEKAINHIESAPTDQLTPRQNAVFLHLKQGKANKLIAYELSMSESTVKIHIRNIMRKMGATNRTEAVYKSQMLSACYEVPPLATLIEG
jgi:DNA-binding NarL/FixJ family response regulator